MNIHANVVPILRGIVASGQILWTSGWLKERWRIRTSTKVCSRKIMENQGRRNPSNFTNLWVSPGSNASVNSERRPPSMPCDFITPSEWRRLSAIGLIEKVQILREFDVIHYLNRMNGFLMVFECVLRWEACFTEINSDYIYCCLSSFATNYCCPSFILLYWERAVDIPWQFPSDTSCLATWILGSLDICW